MKQIFTLFAMVIFSAITFLKASAQFSENFETGTSSLSSNCWQFSNISDITSTYVINGLKSIGTTTTSSSVISTPYLTISGTPVVSFNYKIDNKLSNNAQRTFEMGTTDKNGTFTKVSSFAIGNSTKANTLYSYSSTLPAMSGTERFTLRIVSNGDGNTAVIVDDLSVTNATLHYTSPCNSAPVVTNDVYFGTASGDYISDHSILDNDTDPDNEALTPSIVAKSTDGVVNLNEDGTFTFTPNPGFNGDFATFTYQVTDNGYDALTSATATVRINFSSAIPLPVNLTSFQGARNKDNVQLQWSVADNQNAQRFEVESSSNGKDFTTVAIVMASQNSGKAIYKFYKTATGNKVMYRLKVYDNDIKYEYSKILFFEKEVANEKSLRILNNPESDKVMISFTTSTSEALQLNLYDFAGRLVQKQIIKSFCRQ